MSLRELAVTPTQKESIRRKSCSRILLVDLNNYFGGGQVYLVRLVRLLQDHSVIFALTIDPKLTASLRGLGVKTLSMPYSRNLGKALQLAFAAMMLLYVRLRYRVDTVWIQGSSEIILLPWARLLGCMARATRHGTFGGDHKSRSQDWRCRIKRSLHRTLAFSVDRMICVSETVAEDAAGAVPSRKLIIIPNWVPPLRNFSRSRLVDGAPLRILSVGRLEKHKRVDLMLQAVRSINKTSGRQRVLLTIVGDGAYRAELENQANDIDAHFVGFQEDPAPFYRNADIFLNASMGPEGLPLVSIEAMSHGLPCIFSDIPVHKEISSSGRGALLFTNGDWNDLRSKIELLADSPWLLRRYGYLGRELVDRKHSEKAASASYLKELQVSP